jgi:hypothetical protein
MIDSAELSFAGIQALLKFQIPQPKRCDNQPWAVIAPGDRAGEVWMRRGVEPPLTLWYS